MERLVLLNQLETGDHLCQIYDTDEEYRAVLAVLFEAGLKKNVKIIWVADPDRLEAHLQALRPALDGLDAALDRGQIMLVTRDKDPKTEPSAQLDLMQIVADEVQRQAQAGMPCWVIPDMGWMIGKKLYHHQTPAFFSAHNLLSQSPNCISVLQCQRQAFDAGFLLDVLLAHPVIILGRDVLQNFYYSPHWHTRPEDLPNLRLEQWIGNLRRAHDDNEELKMARFWLESVSDAIYWVGPRAQILYANRAACQMLGYSLQELLNMSVFDIDAHMTPGDWRERAKEFQQKHEVMLETTHRTKSGVIKPVEITVTHMVYQGREYNCAIVRDISERIEAAERLREMQEDNRLLVEEVRNIAMFILGTEGQVRSWNIGAERLLGYTSNDILGRSYACLFLESDIQSNWPEFEMSMAEQKGIYERDGWQVRQDKSRFWGRTIISALFDDNSRVIGYTCMIRDLTSHRIRQDQIRGQRRSALDEF